MTMTTTRKGGSRSSRLPGFYKLDLRQRHDAVADATGIQPDALDLALTDGGLNAETADKFVENVLGTYALPYAVALNVRVNDRDFIVPMVVEEPSVVAAASNAARMVRASSTGGFRAEIDPPLMISQIQLVDVPHLDTAIAAIVDARREILSLANAVVPGLVERGGGARELVVRVLGASMLVIHVIVDCGDAMGANLVNTIAEGVAPRLAELARARAGLRILSNLADRRCVRVTCRVNVGELATETMPGSEVARGIESASRLAEIDPYRAATHNKGIMNGVDAVILATGNDWRAIEAGAHAFAAKRGRYAPLATWRVVVDEDDERDAAPADILFGQLEMPMAVGTVGGTLRVHRGARLSLEILGCPSAGELGAVAASVGLASNLAALRALASDGIQRGHMALHARAVALAAEAPPELVDHVASIIVEGRDVTIAGARRVLAALRPPELRVTNSLPNSSSP